MNFYKSLFVIALPIILQNFLTSFVNMLDTVMVGQLGAIEIAAVGLGNQIFFIMNTAIFGVCSGGSIFIAQFWGKKDIKSLRETMGITITISIIITGFFTIMAFFFPELCLSIYTNDPAVIEKGAVYLRTVAPSYIFIGFGFAWAHAERSTEHVRLPMFATGFSVIFNALGNLIFIFGLKINGLTIIPALGVMGAALATVISRILETGILVIVPVVKKYEIVGKLSDYRLKTPGFLARYIKIALPVLINESLWGSGISLENSIFAHAGTDIVAAYNIFTTIHNLVWVFFIGVGNAAAIIIGKKIGESKDDEARKTANHFGWFMPVCAAGLALLIIPLSFTLPHIFKVSPEINRTAARFLYMMMFMYPFCAFNMCIIVGVCRSGGDTIFASLIDVGYLWIIALPLGFAGVIFFHWPFWLLFICIQTENLLKAISGFIRLKSGKWLHNVTV